MAVALRGKRYLRGVVIFVLAELVIGLCVAVVAASEVSINKIKLPRDVTHTLPGGFPLLLHISVACVPPHWVWTCCLMQVADGGEPTDVAGADAPDGSHAVPQVVRREPGCEPGWACRRGHGHANQAITFGALLGGCISLVRALFFWVAQLLGVVAAVLLLRLPTGGVRPPGFVLAAGVSDGHAVLLELAMTFGLMYAYYATVVDPKRSRVGAVAPLAVGFLIGAMKLAGGPFISAGMNMAWVFLDAVLLGLVYEFSAGLRRRRWKRPWGPPAMPWGPSHVLWVRWRPDAWHAAAGAHPLLCCGLGDKWMACLLQTSQFSLSICGFVHLQI